MSTTAEAALPSRDPALVAFLRQKVWDAVDGSHGSYMDAEMIRGVVNRNVDRLSHLSDGDLAMKLLMELDHDAFAHC